ncbi:glycosyltransferase [Rhodobacter sp. KR11]|uniref:glycosyltransferase n=1 Tax=Rhodobacter sp. KR11 TaxID=2974588 RepID=UPI002223348A|nr:glycosyltransferase [Rhodobacter sp. KR11]MCW1918870.1 glycosyltransferase [Rhodobacter sp. KR11]
MSDAPLLAIIIPVYRHSVLMVEAVDSALAQEAPFGIQVVIVNDGCPHPETHETGLALARAHPDRVTYLKKPNGGLSSARNHGIDHVLTQMPSVRAIYMLDADNRLRPPAMARAMQALTDDPLAGWIYPDIDMVGLTSGHDYSGPYSILLHTAMNTCEAGSLIRREVFDAGVRFDIAFKAGFEDWDFFLSAVQAGFRGKNIEGMGFLYRKRPESMLADSEREREPILARMRAKHRALFAPRALLELEQEEAPRYAFYLSDLGRIWLTTDPSEPGQMLKPKDYALRLWQARAAPGRFVLPPLTVVTQSVTLTALRRAGVLHNMLWQLEALLDQSHMAALMVSPAEGERMGFAQLMQRTRAPDDAAVLMLTTKAVTGSAAVPIDAWMETLTSDAPKPHVSLAELTLPPDLAGVPQGAASGLLQLVALMRGAPWAKAATLTDWREADLARRAGSHLILRRRMGGQPVPPMLRGMDRHIGLLMTIVEFGGVEKVALNLARSFKARGWKVHLFIAAHRDAALGPDWRETLTSVNFLGDPEFWAWGEGDRSYFGNEIPRWAVSGNHARLIALLHGMDVVIDLHSGAGVAVMSQLRKQGVVTATSLHLADLSALGRPSGNPFLGLAYEHAFDLFLPCSQGLGDWLHGLGIPEDKIIPVINAPSFPIAPDVLTGLLEARQPGPRLRALFLGRLDAQKGLERLAQVIARSRPLPIDWRVIGKAVLEDGSTLPPAVAEVLEPALTSPEALTAAFAAADVLVLLSDYEGLPLTVLEAMRQGVVPLATDVGAVCEAVGPDTGFLLPLDGAVPACLQALARLAADPALLTRLSQAAAAQARDWTEATEDLSRVFDALTATRSLSTDSDIPPPAHLADLSPLPPLPPLDLTPLAWTRLQPGTRAELEPFVPHEGFLQIGAPEGSGVTCTLETRLVRDRFGRESPILALRPKGEPQPWSTYELVLNDLALSQLTALDWDIRYALVRPRHLFAQFILNGGGHEVTVVHGSLLVGQIGARTRLRLDLARLTVEQRRLLTKVRLILSTDGELLPLDLLDLQVTGLR